jgi:molybdopterin/thiamine biosynthesis adenylyltransferase
MSAHSRYVIKFKHGDLACLRGKLLADLSSEHFAVLLGKTRKINGHTMINVVDLLFPARADYHHQSVALLRIKKDFIHKALVELTSRYDVDTIIDVHTHPFTQAAVSFSATDDDDEKTFFRFLKKTFDGMHYASIVFSQRKYSARVWMFSSGSIVARKALLKTQTSPENIPSADFHEYVAERGEMLRYAQRDKGKSQHDKGCSQRDKGNILQDSALIEEEGIFHRSALALGLDVMRTIMHDQVVSIVGVGGLGSIVAEHLIHMGFHELNLIDPDVLEMSNLNRVVGAYYEDAQQKRYKVEVVKRHVTSINPHATVQAYTCDVHDKEVESVLALSDWIIVATDNHASRLKVQELSVQYFVPLVSLGVNITVKEHKIEDMSGEVITARVGDYLCLHCLNRINPIKIASERHPDQTIREALVHRGYVSGMDIKEPAVKTLNTTLATMAVEVLINQYTESRRHVAVLVYENNGWMRIYEDRESVEQRNKRCFLCNV